MKQPAIGRLHHEWYAVWDKQTRLNWPCDRNPTTEDATGNVTPRMIVQAKQAVETFLAVEEMFAK